MTPPLNTFLEEKLKEFDEKFMNEFKTDWEWNYGDGRPEAEPEDIKKFISASISEAWEINNLKK